MARRRVLILLCAFLVAGAVLIARLGQIQIGWHDAYAGDYRGRASGHRQIETARGSIYTAEGEVLARDVAVFDLSIHYSRLKEYDWLAPVSELTGESVPDWLAPVSQLTGQSVADLRAEALEITTRVERVWRSVSERNPGIRDLRIVEQEQFHPVVRDIPPQVAILIRTAPDRFPHVEVTQRARRVYHNGDLAPHVVGRCAPINERRLEQLQEQGLMWTVGMPVSQTGKLYRQDDTIGTEGLERGYEDALRGRRGHVINHLFFQPLKVERRSTTEPPQPGLDIHLTLRADFQRAVNASLAEASRDPALSFASGAMVIMDVRTGAVLAAGTWPTYDGDTYREDFESLRTNQFSPLLFRPTQGALPTGSVYKLLTAIAALEEGAITSDTTFHCAGGVRFQRRWFSCTGSHGAIALLRAIERSCNAFFFQAGAKVGGEALAKWGRRFGLGERTGVDLPFERSGQIPTPRSLFGTLNLSIGQGPLLCTPLQIARVCAAIANGGTLVQPHFVDHLTRADGEVVQWAEPRTQTIEVSAETLRLVREGMRRVVEDGTARGTGLRRFRAAGKTGTAERGAGRPNHAWFAGFAPYDDPKIAFAVVSERTPGHGGSHAAPIMDKALEQIWPAVEEMP